MKKRALSAKQRAAILVARRNEKMARSAHAYMRGSTVKFYEWLDSVAGRAVPAGPEVWICGDCHVGNLGPIANLDGRVDIQIRDLDQTVIGNPAHDVIRLALSLATAIRSSDLPGVTTPRMLEQVAAGYAAGLMRVKDSGPDQRDAESIYRVMEVALQRRWKHLSEERIQQARHYIPRNDKFWDLNAAERRDIDRLLQSPDMRTLITSLRGRNDDAEIALLDHAYWVKGCSSLGRLRYAALIDIGDKASDETQFCFLDIKEAVTAAAPRSASAEMPRDNAARVVAGALHLSPNLGERMLAGKMQGRSVVVRELLPQDLKLEMGRLSEVETGGVARYLASVVGHAHARQMDRPSRLAWRKVIQTSRSKTLDAPSWLWASVVDLIGIHESAYLEHCRRFAQAAA
jgi:uncharacterized protein (DUF2252 family)